MDPYALCPCGSGKKVKFCCQKIVPELEKIERLQENQPELALQHLDKLEESHPGNPWVVTTKSGILLQLGRFQQAKIALLKFLKDHPEHPRANALYAMASVNADGFPACRKAISRACKRSVGEDPELVAALLEAAAENHLFQDQFLAARSHYLVAMRVSQSPEGREHYASRVMSLDSDRSIPFLLRGGQSLPAYTPTEELQPVVDKARRLANLGCFEDSAELLAEAIEKDPESPELWHLAGLTKAWCGQEDEAAAALHRAGELYGADDFAMAVECETISQFLDRRRPDRSVPMQIRRYTVSSVSQLLSRLDDEKRFRRVGGDDKGTPGAPVAVYLCLDRPVPEKEKLRTLTADTVPLYVGRLMVFDRSAEDDEPAMALLTGLEGDQLQTAERAFTKAAGELAEPKPEGETDGAGEPALGRIPHHELPLHRNFFVPPQALGRVRREVMDTHWRYILEKAWPETPQPALDDQTPAQAAVQPELKVPLAAALYVLDNFFDERGQMLPVAEVRRRLRIELPAPLELEPDTSIASLTQFEMTRVNPKTLTDDQLNQYIERVSFSRHGRMLYGAIQELLERDWKGEAEPWMTRETAATILLELALEGRMPEEALKWAQIGMEEIESGDQAFERKLTWKLRELQIRVATGNADEVSELMSEIYTTYGSKLPHLRTQLTQAATSLGLEPPWESSIITSGGEGDSWSGPAAAGVGAGDEKQPKKLWLPGQD